MDFRQRYRCRDCRKRFSEHSWSLHYRLKNPDPALNAKIFRLCVHGLSNRRIASMLYVSEHCVRLRLERMSRQALCFQAQKMQSHKITEALCFDGLENFAGSQYDVNNIQQALGRDSLFIYDFNLATMNRKGRISNWQRRRLADIEANEGGRYNPRAIRLATKDILLRLHQKWGSDDRFTLYSDEHFQYRRVVKQDLRHLKIHHVTVNSKRCRNFQNILFPVNHVDLLIRQNVGAFSRETISFSKTHAAMCQKYALYMVYKNYMIPQFTKPHVRRPDACTKSPAEHLGLCTQILEFDDVFYKRVHFTDETLLNADWKYFLNSEIPPQYERDCQFKRHKPAS